MTRATYTPTVPMRVLVVDDHDELLDLLVRSLERDGHLVEAMTSLGDARDWLARHSADVLVLDVALPDGNGFELCRSLRAAGVSTPILLVTAHQSIGRRVEGLDAGADDFLGKPFAVAELRARVRALGRRGPMPKPLRLERGLVALDFLARRAEVAGAEVPLTAREWSVLDLLASRHGRVVSRAEILEIAWGDRDDGGASLDVLIARIRRKLGDDLVRTLRGHGYALADA